MTPPDRALHEAMRGTRLETEYEDVERVLRAWDIRSTVVVFGSAAIASPERPSAARWATRHRAWYDAARRFGGLIAARGGDRHVIATGGGPGLMEAANRGAADAGAPTVGFNIELPASQPSNAYVTPALHFRFHYFAIRKLHFAMRARALVAFPGGFGTLDELFEILTLQQTRKMPTARIVLFDRGFWKSVLNFDALIEAGVLRSADLDLLHYADTPERAAALLADA
jgi:uncharacterized protein (TIGR00730 family)